MKKMVMKKTVVILSVSAVLLLGVLTGGIYAISRTPGAHGKQTVTDAGKEKSGAGLETESQEQQSEIAEQPETTIQPETITEPETTTQAASQQSTSAQSSTKKASGEKPATQKATEKLVISNKADTFFQNSVFVGDSVMTGLQYYVMGQEKGFLANPTFLALSSFSAFWDLQPVTDTSIHPEYQGKKGKVEDLIVKMNPKKVFLFFGINDLTMTGLNQAAENYKEVTNRILQKSPHVQIYIISATNIYKGSDKLNLTNKNIDSLNAAMKSYCVQKGYGYIDITDYLTGADGTLLEKYSSDHYVHLTYEAYEVWVKVLRSYATNQISKAEEESSRRAAEEESSRRAAEEESSRRAAEEESSRRAAEEESSRRAAEEESSRRAAEEESSRRAAEEESSKKAAEEAARTTTAPEIISASPETDAAGTNCETGL